MDNLAHSLVGLAASKAGLERLSPTSTALCIVAANAPDGDILVSLYGGRWSVLQHHRGITHSIIGTLTLALIIPFTFYLLDLFVAHLSSMQPRVRLKGLVLASLIVSATHPLMDWSNNYGIRLLLPWGEKWSYGDLVFIVDPFVWLIMGGAAFLLTSNKKWQVALWLLLWLPLTIAVLDGPMGRMGVSDTTLLRFFWIMSAIVLVILYRLGAGRRLGGKVALAAFALAALYWGGLALLHRQAFHEAKMMAETIAGPNGEHVTRLAAMPTFANFLRWQCVSETEAATYRFEIYLPNGPQKPSGLVRYAKIDPAHQQALAAALRDVRAQIFLGFARFPVVRVFDADCPKQTLVQFADLRYTEPGQPRGSFSLEVPVACSRQAAQLLSE
jgi:inner membrane protein